MLKKTIILFFILFSFFRVAFSEEASKGKWDGAIDLGIGSNFSTGLSTHKFSHSLADVSAWGRYRKKKFSIQLNLQCLSKFTTVSTSESTINVEELLAPQVDVGINHNEGSAFNEGSAIQVEYTPNERNSFSFAFNQKFDRLNTDIFNMSMHNVVDGDDYSNMRTTTFLDAEEGRRKDEQYSARAKWTHKFDKTGRVINSNIVWLINKNNKHSNWYRMIAEDDDEEIIMDYASFYDSDQGDATMSDRIFRFTPFDKKNDLQASVFYCDENLFGKDGLNIELGADFRMSYEQDRLSAANYEDDVWIDSLQYRKNFNYVSMDITPIAKLSYTPGKFNFNLSLLPDFYLSKLSGDTSDAKHNLSKVYFLPEFSVNWKPSPKHTTGLSVRQGVIRPTYLQICPFRRIGVKATEIMEGNPNLKPSRNAILSLFYTFHSGFFTGTIEGTEKFTWDKIDKVFSNEGEYRIYTWINSGRSFDNNIKLTLKADFKKVNLEIGGYYNYFIGRNNTGTTTRSSNWGLNGNAILRIKGGWEFLVKGRYLSEIIRTYNSITEYIGCDVRITKNFKKFLIYLDGKDLFDRPIMVTTYSLDKTYAHFDDKLFNRRIFSIGASFKF